MEDITSLDLRSAVKDGILLAIGEVLARFWLTLFLSAILVVVVVAVKYKGVPIPEDTYWMWIASFFGTWALTFTISFFE
ncbi:MAG: hypothetical protein GY861_21120 [bacterium]|nr:hypothetical protein [bacterium]